MRVVIPVLATLALVLPAAAQESPRRSPFEDDARLEKRITVSWKKQTLYDALTAVSKLTGVRMAPDRALVDEPVMVSAVDVPARELLEQIGKLLHFTWIRESGGKEGAHGYLLYQDRLAREEEEAMLNGAERAVLQAIQQEVDRYRQLSRLSPERMQRELEQADRAFEGVSGGFGALASDPNAIRRFQSAQAVRTVASPVGRAMVEVVDGLSDQQWSALRDGQQLVFSTQPREGETRMDAGLSDRLRTAVPEVPFPKAIFKALGPQVEAAIGTAEKAMQDNWSRGNGFRVTVQLNLNMGAQPLGMLRVSPEPLGTEAALGPLMALAGLNITGAPTMLPEAKEDPAAREKRLSEHPVLGKKAVLKLPPLRPETGLFAMLGQSYRSAEILSNVEEAFGVHLLGDAYNRQALTLFPPPSSNAPQPLYKVLDTLAGVGREWELDGTVVRMRSRQWAHDRRAEIPVRYMRRWLAVREKKGGFNLDDLAEIVTLLRDEQVESLMFSALEAGGSQDFTDFVMISSNREPLRLWGKLVPTQRQALQAGREIAVRQLFPYQQRQLLGMNKRQSQSLFSFAQGTKPQRTPAQLADATLSLQRRDLTDEQRRRAEGALGGQRPGAGAPFNIPSTIYTIAVTFPGGEKDSYTLPLAKPTAAAATAAN